VRGALRARQRQYDARRAIESRDQFLAMLGHELRNPLAAIRLATSLLAQSDDPERSEHHQLVIDRQTRHLSRLIDDLLDVARVTYGKVSIRPERVQLEDVLRGCCQSLESIFQASSVSLDVRIEPPLSLRGDRVRLEQIFSNLLQNAVKYTPRGGSVLLSAAAEATKAVVRVKDSGVGIEDVMLHRVFDLFAQADKSLDRAHGGLGIGLTLVRSLVQLHGGTVSATSAGLGRGSEFRVELPLAASDPRRLNPPSLVQARKTSSARVVLVEDGDDIRDMLRELLEMEGHVVYTAQDGPTGVERILEVEPDVAFVDIGLPAFDGYEVARQVRARGSRTRLVALTGYGQSGDRAHARASGFDQHLTKPIDLVDLQGALARPSRAD
jgi:CheY-like chemotaxis protein/two-component sensor histidine kinase